MTHRALPAILVLALAACSGDDAPAPSGAPERLSEWNLFADGARQIPAEGVYPYTVIAPLFADFAGKYRFFRLPAGGRITYSAEGFWDFPVGSVLAKTFSYADDLRDPTAPERVVETRLLVRTAEAWEAHTYVWDDAQTDATLTIAGRRVPSSFIDVDGERVDHEYRVPAVNACVSCHGLGAEVNGLLGLRTRQLDRDLDFGDGPENQIDHFAALGLFDGAPPPAAERQRLLDPYGDGELELRARSWLEANCSHCHRPEAAATASGVYFNLETTEPRELGVCRFPFAAGRGSGGRPYDIVPGDPERSILVYRISSTEPGVKMPEIPIVLVDHAGVALVREWIASMPADDCM